MDPGTGKILVDPTLQEIKEKGLIPIHVGEIVELKGCKCEVTYINSGKGRITLQLLPKIR